MKCIIDTDPGIDDAMAIFFALASPELEVLGLTIVHGNLGDLHRLGTNARIILEAAGRPEIPVYLGIDKSIKFPSSKGAPFVHGDNGLGNVDFPEPKISYRTDKTAVEFIVDTCRTNANDITLICLGPMTNIATALYACPTLPKYVPRIYSMSGSFVHMGNISATAEANIYNDPDAAHIVFSADWEVHLCPLNVTHKTEMLPSYIESLASSGPVGKFIRDIAQCYLKFYIDYTKKEGMHVHDSSAILAAVRPDLYTKYEIVSVAVECVSSLTRGQTVADFRPYIPKSTLPKRNVKIYMDVHAHGFLKFYKDRINQLDQRLAKQQK